MRLIFLGPPGVGKGTHAEVAAEHYAIIKISTGDLLRAARDDPEHGKTIIHYQDTGGLVPDEIVLALLKKRLEQPDAKKGFIFDGFPRTIPQAKTLETITNIDLVVNFSVSEDTLMQRLGGRLTCRKCDSIYHVKNRPPKEEGICDECGGELYVRNDQKPEVIKERLEAYEEKTESLIDYYKKKNLLVDFNAEGEIPDVSRRLIELLDSHFKGVQ